LPPFSKAQQIARIRAVYSGESNGDLASIWNDRCCRPDGQDCIDQRARHECDLRRELIEVAPSSARNAAAKALMAFAVGDGWRQDNPTTGTKRIKSRTDGFHTWTEEEIAQFEAVHPVGGKARLALALLLYTPQRRSDVVGIGRQHIRNGVLHIKQKKTGASLAIPVHPELARIIAATPSGNLTLLTTSFGKTFTAAGFGNWFRERCNEAQLPGHCAAHVLRKAACRRLAEAGCSANVIASISGHRTLTEVSRYTRAADQERLARAGVAAITGTESVNYAETVDKSAKYR